MTRPFDFATKSTSKSGTGAQTDTEIIAAVTAKRIHIKRLVITSSALADITVNSRTAVPANTKIIKFLDTKSVVLEGFDHLKTANGSALAYTTTGGNSEVYVEYHEG